MLYDPASTGIEIVTADRQRCPVCGDPHGDCVGDTPYSGQIRFIPQKINDPRATFRVPKRVYIEELHNGKKRKKLLYSVGAAITIEEAQRLGLMPK